ncbi:MAG: hypothetical protein LKK23_03030, partial [Sphaerochaeta sp.]|nr:hypothetical protein [Sphaerochaeta sp.]MCI2104013.1 hypothetical protein [Sphaerochaeta sp.]
MDRLWIVVSLALSLLTLVIMFLLRAEDKKEKSFSRVMELISRFRSEAGKTESQLKETSQQASNEINAQVNNVHNLMRSIDAKILDLEGRSEDLSKLQAVMNNYRDVMVQLNALTDQAEGKIQLVNEQVAEVKRIESVIAGFREEIAQARQAIQNDLDASKATISTLEAETLQRLGDTRQTVEKTMQNCKDVVSGLKTTLQEEEDAAIAAVHKETEELRQLGQKTDTLVESSKEQFNQLQADSVAQVNKDLSAFTIASTQKLETVFKQTIEQIDASFLTMVHTSQVFINELDSRLASTKEITSSLEAKSADNLAQASRRLDSYSRQIAAAQAEIVSQENRKKQMEESIHAIQEEAQALHQELNHLKEEKAAIIKEREERPQPVIIPAPIPTNPVQPTTTEAPEEPQVPEEPEATEEP